MTTRRPATVHLLVRAAQDRILATLLSLFAHCAAWPEVARYEVKVPPRAGHRGRTATVALRFGEVVLKRPSTVAKTLPDTLTLRVVEPSVAASLAAVGFCSHCVRRTSDRACVRPVARVVRGGPARPRTSASQRLTAASRFRQTDRTGGGKSMGFVEAIRTCLSKNSTFSGRASRSEYWFFYLFVIIASLVGVLIGVAVGVRLIGDIIALALLLPNIAVSVRRLHDIDRSGWWMLLDFVPVIGWIVLLVWACTRGTVGPNRFGPDPLLGAISAASV